jgi:precorrin-3B synthase
LARIRVPGGRMSARQLEVVAEAASEMGADLIEITNRANLQLRGVEPSAAGRLASGLAEAGLTAGERGDRRRNILVSPLTGLDPAEVADVSGLLEAVLQRFDADPRLDGLSPKFGLVIDGGGRWNLRGRRADVVVTAMAAPVEGRPSEGSPFAGQPSEGAPIRFEVRSPGGTQTDVEAGRVAELVVAAARSALGASRRPLVATSPHRAGAPAGGPLGSGEQADPARRWVGAMPLLGRMDGATARAFAALADRYGAGRLRLTPWRGLVLGDVAAGAAPAVLEEAEDLGLVTEGGDPASAVVACAGRGCPASLTDAAGDARAVIARRRQHRRGPVLVHVSGCAKRCAWRGPAPVTLLGTGQGRYDVLRADPSAPDGEQLSAAGVEAQAAVDLAAAAAPGAAGAAMGR